MSELPPEATSTAWKAIAWVGSGLGAILASIFAWFAYRRKTQAETAELAAKTRRDDATFKLTHERQVQEEAERATQRIIDLCKRVETLTEEATRCRGEANNIIRELRNRGYDAMHCNELAERLKSVHGE